MRSQLRTLSKLAADRVARHLVAAGRLVDEDPAAALAHARAARALGSRVAVVRQAAGETAYAAGEWAEAIAELRTARRMTGDDSALPLIADAERALGRPDRALRLAQSPEAQSLPPAERTEMRIVEAGARRDLGQLDAALVTLQGPWLDRRTIEPWSARLWYAYADMLLALGRESDARDWFGAAAAADADGSTDADERVLELDGVEILADEDAEEDLAAGPADEEHDEQLTGETHADGQPSTDGLPTEERRAEELPESPHGELVPGDGHGAAGSGAPDGGAPVADAEPVNAESVADAEPVNAESVADAEPVNAEPVADAEPVNAEPVDDGEPADGGAAPVTDAESVADRGEPADGEPADRGEPADGEPGPAAAPESPATVLAFSDADQPPDQSGSSA